MIIKLDKKNIDDLITDLMGCLKKENCRKSEVLDTFRICDDRAA